MPPTCAESVSTHTLAHTQAIHNLAANRAAIARIQSNLNIGELPDDVEWLFGRDRALTFRDASGQWFTGCSLPRRAAAEMMRKLDVAGVVACFLAPSHGAQLRVALDKLRPEQAIVAIVSRVEQISLLLACDNFAIDIEGHRLWFAAGENWAQDLKQLFADVPGLCTPTQFIRLPVAEEGVAEQLIPAAQKVFADANSSRASALGALRRDAPRCANQLCVVAPSNFRLWDDAGASLAELLQPLNPILVNPDDPAQASPLSLAQRARDCGAIVTANMARTDLPNVLDDSIRWITWASDTRIPTARGACAHDRLITGYPNLAFSAGWKSEQVIKASHPASSRIEGSGTGALALIVNTNPLDVPDNLTDFSSHRVLWELITADLHDNPFALTEDIDAFLTRRMRRLDIAAETLSSTRFISELILPAYQQSLARLLIREKIPVRIFGTGWDRIPEFAPHACGAITGRDHLREIASDDSALVHAWPATGPHAIDAIGRPVLRRRFIDGACFISDARLLLTGRAISAPNSPPPLTCELIQNLL